MIALVRNLGKRSLVALHNGGLLGTVKTLAPAFPVSVLGIHALLEEGAHLGIVEARESGETRVLSPAVAPHQLVEADSVEVLRVAHLAIAPLRQGKPALPPLDARSGVGWMVGLLGFRDLRGA